MSTNNIGIGIGALTTNEGNDNIAIGTDALKYNTTGDYNIAIGTDSGSSENTAIFSYNTFIGYETSIDPSPLTSTQGVQSSVVNVQNSTAIGYQAKIFEANQIVLGTASDYVYIPKQMSIGKVGTSNQISRRPAAGVGLDVSGSLLVSGNITGNDITGNNMIMNDISANTLFLDTRLVTNGDISGNGDLFVGGDISGNGDLFVGGNIYKNGVEINSNNFAADQVKALYSDEYKNTYVGSNTTLLGGSGYQGIERSTTIGYGANIDVSNQIVLGTSGEFVCIPSNRGLSIGKTTAPTSGVGLDVSGSIAINTGLMKYNKNLYNMSLFSDIIFSGVPISGYDVDKGFGNIAIGPLSLSIFTANGTLNNPTGNISIGAYSMQNTTTGLVNVSIGSQSMMNNTTGSGNTSIGTNSLNKLVDGSNNTSIGRGAMEFGKTNLYNTSIGDGSGYNDISGAYNTYIGVNTRTDTSLKTYRNSTAIGHAAEIDASNQIVLGRNEEFVCIPSNRGLSIGKKTAPASNYALDVVGSINFSGNLYQNGSIFVSGSGGSGSGTSNSITGGLFVSQDISGNGNLDITGDISGNGDLFVRGSVEASSYNATSDYRIKDNVRNLDEEDTISNLRPVKYLNKQTNKNDFGLIAHELQLEYPDLVSGTKDGTEYQSVNYTGLISILIKEIQDLKIITSNQTIKLESQATQLERINKLLFPND
jgi:hypothetical protein